MVNEAMVNKAMVNEAMPTPPAFSPTMMGTKRWNMNKINTNTRPVTVKDSPDYKILVKKFQKHGGKNTFGPNYEALKDSGTPVYNIQFKRLFEDEMIEKGLDPALLWKPYSPAHPLVGIDGYSF